MGYYRDKLIKDYCMDFYILKDVKHDHIIAVKPTLEDAVYAREKYEKDMVKLFLSACHTDEEREEVRPKYALYRVNYPTGVAILAKEREKALKRLKEMGIMDDDDDEIPLE